MSRVSADMTMASAFELLNELVRLGCVGATEGGGADIK